MYPPKDDIPLSRPIILKAPNEVQGVEFGRVTRAYWLVPLKTIARDANPRLVIVAAKARKTTKLAIMITRKADLISSPGRVRLAYLTKTNPCSMNFMFRDFA